jgi:Flp pilus assembly protein TadG
MAHLRKRRRLGQAVVLVAVSAMVLAGILMLALDGGLLYLDRRQLQSAADAAALAGAEFLWQSFPQSYTQSHQKAMTILTSTLFATVMPSPFTPVAAQVDNGSGGPLAIGGGYSVILNGTPTSYQVTLWHQHNFLVAPVHGFASSLAISVTAKATNANLPFAMVVLQSPTAYADLQVASGASLTLTRNGGASGAGGVFSDESIDPGAGSIYFNSTGCSGQPGVSGDLWAVNESGGDQGRVNTQVFCGQAPPEVRVPSAALTDPGYPRPQPPAVTWSGVSVWSGTEYLCPGSYSNQITVSAGATAVLLPGVFRILTDGVKVTGTLRTLNTGESVGLTNGCALPVPNPPAGDLGAIVEIVPADDGTFSCSKSVFQTFAGSSLTLKPSPRYSNISVYVELMPNWQTTCSTGVKGTNAVRITGGGAYTITGAIYAPADNVQIAGGGAGSSIGQVIAWTAAISGGDVKETYDPAGLPFQKGLIQ